jgi:FkbM family methyltransferase
MFNNCNSKTNGEQLFFLKIKEFINTIFDVGCRNDTEFLLFKGEVHYFDPVEEYINLLSLNTTNKNKLSIYNTFGLGGENTDIFYYPRYQSFYNRVNSCKVNDDTNKVKLTIKKAKDYINKNNINSIDFVKIDTEGYELDVLKGFEECLKIVKIIQFEYGGTYLDNNINLLDVIQYLEKYGFHKFSYLTSYGIEPIIDFNDHYQYCNIVCINKNSDYIPY